MTRKGANRHNPGDAAPPSEASVEVSAELRDIQARAAALESLAGARKLQKRGFKVQVDKDLAIERELETARAGSQTGGQAKLAPEFTEARAEKDLERARASHARESEQTTAKLEQLHEALAVAREAVGRTSGKPKTGVGTQILIGLAVVMMVGSGGLETARYLHRNKAMASETVESPVEPPSEEPAEAPVEKAPSDFSDSVGRINSALNRFPGVNPETIMGAANRRAPISGSIPCAFLWNDGQPELQFGGRPGGSLSLPETLSRCATAVDQLRPTDLASKPHAASR